jgi:hypothetical protein
VLDQGIIAPADRWSTLRTEPAFLELVRLARIVNSLALAYLPVQISLDDQSPAARRDRFSAMVYTGALLHEGLHVAQGLGKFFRDLGQYRAGFAQLFGDENVKTFRTNILDRLRDKSVFHVDRDALAVGLARCADGDRLLVSFSSDRQGHVHFDIADDALLLYLFGDGRAEADCFDDIEGFFSDIAVLHGRFMEAAHSLLPAALYQLGCVSRKVDRPLPPPVSSRGHR